MRDFELQSTRRSPRAPAHDPDRAAHPEPGQAPAAGPRALDATTVMRLQRSAGNAGVVQMLAAEEDQASPVHDVIQSGGEPLDAQTRATMESAFGTSFESVRVHTDAQASQSAESVGANAYTVGSDVVFRSGQFDPGTSVGQRTIAHELAHVVQQSQGPVDGTDAPGGIRVSDPADRFERAADHTAEQVVSSLAAPSSSAASSSAAAPTAQLEEDPAAPAQVQRQAEGEEQEDELEL
jgi:hypothetical protein